MHSGIPLRGRLNNQNKILLDEIALEDGNGGVFRIDQSYSYSCTVDITGSTFNASTGGIDTGAVAASTWYYHWVIYNPTTNTPSCLDSTSSTAPTMPSGFTFKARVGANATDGGTNKCFQRVQQYGRIAHYVGVGSLPLTNCGTATGYGAQTFAIGQNGTGGSGSSVCSTASPTLISRTVTGNGFPAPSTAVRVNVNINIIAGGSAGTCMLVAPSAIFSGTNNGPSGTNGLNWQMGSPASGIGLLASWYTLESSALYYASSNNSLNQASISEWEDGL